MNSSLSKKRNNAQKENSHRLSNTKIISAYNPLSKLACSEFITDDKIKNTSRKNNRLKTTRKHHLSVQYILQSKCREPYCMKTVQIQKDKVDTKTKEIKMKKKKKDPIINEESRFNIPVYEFSRSNSLIVFSEKDSTINANSKKQRFFFSKSIMNPIQAATLIQKTWRGYLTRKLLQQYINDEEYKLVQAFHTLKSKQQSFFVEEKPDEMNFSEFSEIQEDTVAIGTHCEAEWSYSRQGAAYTELASSGKDKSKQYPTIPKNFFKNHKTEPDFSQSKLSTTSKNKPKKNLNIHSSTLSYFINLRSDCQQVKLQNPENPSIEDLVNSLKGQMQQHWMNSKKKLKEYLVQGKLEIGELAIRSNKIKQIHGGTIEFLNNVILQLQAIKDDIDKVVENSIQGEEIENNEHSQTQYQPKSQMFTLQLQQNQPENQETREHYSEGQLKIQTYLNDLIDDYQTNFAKTSSQLEYLCQVLKINTERGVRTISERCLLQFTVQTITSNYNLEQLIKTAFQQSFGENEIEAFIVKWINQINKWEMGPIQEVTQAMQSSSFMNGQSSKSALYQ